MNAIYKVSGVSKQAVHQHIRDQNDWSERLSELRDQADEIRSIHSGCGLEKLYDTLRPSWMGRDKFISTFMDLGYRVSKKVRFTRTTFPTTLRYPNLIEGL